MTPRPQEDDIGLGVGHFRSEAARSRFLDRYRSAVAALPVHSDSRDVTTRFGTVRTYRFDGPAGRPVVLLPGRNASTPIWAPNLPSLMSHRTFYAVDLLGEPGLSVQRRPVCDADDQARWLDDLLGGLGLSSPHLMGVSFGGWAAANYAVRRPDRTASLVLVDPVMTFAPIPIRTMLAVAPMTIPGVPEAYRRRVLRWLSGGAEIDYADPIVALIAAGTADFESRQPLPERFTANQLRALDVPVLALLAGRSVIHDATRAAVTARNFLRHSQIELWPEASHAINGEYPAQIAETAGAFWADVDRRT
ncbi:alpha/beta fold hydrolase [Mycobacterium sp. IDR2000157661]|uniref:alpha/beta fold hydrolase n=1 Tax=Mycobacterium sp. IDR2000157661 TaxID=2867005 RepID=UPI001EEAE08F|nr:alpha/beta hydrolase [Mycobacterium sp. IDR2000157661]ULE33774.1 alpha/beta hydrolase [Mycobacterium sp. IDR2000157661]